VDESGSGSCLVAGFGISREISCGDGRWMEWLRIASSDGHWYWWCPVIECFPRHDYLEPCKKGSEHLKMKPATWTVCCISLQNMLCSATD
jgi:hypothetical protein